MPDYSLIEYANWASLFFYKLSISVIPQSMKQLIECYLEILE